jgi:hypothetical protein
VPQNKDLKRLVRARMAETGENYTGALAHVQGRPDLDPLPAAWHITGSQAAEYEAGILPGTTYGEDRAAQLRLRQSVDKPGGFGALVQSISASRYLGRRVRYTAVVRTSDVTGWAGLWLRVDGPTGSLVLDNMQDRPLRGTTDWTEATIVLDVAEQARELRFGALLAGGGAVDLTRLRFEEVGDDTPTTTAIVMSPLPDEPQSLDFSTTSP